MSGLSFTKDDIRKYLAEHGFTSNPEGLIAMDYVLEDQDVAYMDVNAVAVRRGIEVPDRPVRIKFYKISYGHSSRWELESVAELAPGIRSEASDRDQYTPKISPWPDKT